MDRGSLLLNSNAEIKTSSLIPFSFEFPAIILSTKSSAVVTFLILSTIDGYVINPYVYGKTNKVHPLVVILSVFAGDEMGVSGVGNLDNRKTMPWGKEDQELLAFFRSIGQIRKNEPFLRTADLKIVDLSVSVDDRYHLKGVDFSSCDINGIIFDNYSLKGIIVDRFQCANLVGALGVEVKE